MFLCTCLIEPPHICLANGGKQLHKLQITQAANEFVSPDIVTSSHPTIHRGVAVQARLFMAQRGQAREAKHGW